MNSGGGKGEECMCPGWHFAGGSISDSKKMWQYVLAAILLYAGT